MNNRHVVSLDQNFDPIIRATLCGSYGKDSNKKLVVATNFIKKHIWFEVKNNNKLELINSDLAVAIDEYNKLP